MVESESCLPPSSLLLFAGVVENLCEFRMDMVCSQAVQQGLMHWLVKRVKVS